MKDCLEEGFALSPSVHGSSAVSRLLRYTASAKKTGPEELQPSNICVELERNPRAQVYLLAAGPIVISMGQRSFEDRALCV